MHHDPSHTTLSFIPLTRFHTPARFHARLRVYEKPPGGWDKWLRTHVWAYVGIAAPLLGSPGALKSVMSGHTFGLTLSEGRLSLAPLPLSPSPPLLLSPSLPLYRSPQLPILIPSHNPHLTSSHRPSTFHLPLQPKHGNWK